MFIHDGRVLSHHRSLDHHPPYPPWGPASKTPRLTAGWPPPREGHFYIPLNQRISIWGLIPCFSPLGNGNHPLVGGLGRGGGHFTSTFPPNRRASIWDLILHFRLLGNEDRPPPQTLPLSMATTLVRDWGDCFYLSGRLDVGCRQTLLQLPFPAVGARGNPPSPSGCCPSGCGPYSHYPAS